MAQKLSRELTATAKEVFELERKLERIEACAHWLQNQLPKGEVVVQNKKSTTPHCLVNQLLDAVFAD